MKEKTNLWPAALCILGFSFIAITGWSIYRATQGVSSITDPRYYSHGLKYNRTSVETAAGQAMGWTLTPLLSADSIELTLTDKHGLAITGCSGSVTFAPSPADGVTTTISLEDLGLGVYKVLLPSNTGKNMAATITLSKDQTTIQRNLLINR